MNQTEIDDEDYPSYVVAETKDKQIQVWFVTHRNENNQLSGEKIATFTSLSRAIDYAEYLNNQ